MASEKPLHSPEVWFHSAKSRVLRVEEAVRKLKIHVYHSLETRSDVVWDE